MRRMVCLRARCVADACRAYPAVCGARGTCAAEDAHDAKHDEHAGDDAAAEEEEDDEDDPQAKKRRQAREAEKRMREANEKAVGIIMKLKKVPIHTLSTHSTQTRTHARTRMPTSRGQAYFEEHSLKPFDLLINRCQLMRAAAARRPVRSRSAGCTSRPACS
jgi:hypothetical protein